MERILNEDDKIKKAEEIYYRRNNLHLDFDNKVKKDKSNLIFDLLIMFNLAIAVFCIQNKNYIFTQDFLSLIDKYSIELTDKIKLFFEKNFEESNVDNFNEIPENKIEKDNVKNELNIVEDTTNTVEILSSTLDEMEEDIKNLKGAYSFISPLQGSVSSTFGARESKYQNVTGYHTGIDIAAESGTLIKASMEGIVELVSSKGDYGNHVKIRCNNITTVYAHCSKIHVKQGQIVAQGQKIAEVGSTGNSTGPHLHFEIRVNDRFVDPGKVINFN